MRCPYFFVNTIIGDKFEKDNSYSRCLYSSNIDFYFWSNWFW